MHLHPSVGDKPRIPGERYREPEVGACGLIRLDLFWMAKVSEVHPVFASDNAFNRTGQCWCSKCGFKPMDDFALDKSLSAKRKKPVFQRLCRNCDRERKRVEREREPVTWKRG